MVKYTSYFLSDSLKTELSKADKSYLDFLGGLLVPAVILENSLVRFINSSVLDFTSFTANELLDSPYQKLLIRPKEEKADYTLRTVLKNRKSKTFSLKVTDRIGNPIEIVVTSKPSVIGNLSQLTELYFQPLPTRQDADSIVSIQNRFEDFSVFAKVANWGLNKQRTKFSLSDECFKLMGVSPSSGPVNYADFLAMLPRKEDKENIEKGLISITGTSEIFQTEIKVRGNQKDIAENFILRFYAKWEDDLQGGKFTGIIQDITANKKIEKELIKAKEKAERSDRLKSHFLTNLSYELRTPMNAILGFSELLSIEDLTKEQKLDYAKIIRSKGNNLLTQIDEVIELSKFETGTIQINKNEFELYPLLKELYDEYEVKRINLSKNNINLLLKVPEEHLSEKIFTDPGRLQQLLSNLLSNAMKFTENGEIEFGYKKSGKFFKFYVKDTGIGIEENDQNLIFNRFHEIEETAAKKYGGTGLSLTISKHIVELLGGRIKVKSELNKGSRFQINIPVESSKRKIPDMTEFDNLNTVNWKDRVILVAEDEEVNYRFLEAVLQKTQAQILRAKTGRDAVELCKNIGKVDLVLMDIKMPVMNGFEATIEIKKIRPLLPVIAQTAFASQDELIKCEQSGCDDIITKPIDIKVLLRKINDLLL